MARSRLEFEPGEAGVEAAQPERLGDADGSQIQWLATTPEPILESRAV